MYIKWHWILCIAAFLASTSLCMREKWLWLPIHHVYLLIETVFHRNCRPTTWNRRLVGYLTAKKTVTVFVSPLRCPYPLLSPYRRLYISCTWRIQMTNNTYDGLDHNLLHLCSSFVGHSNVCMYTQIKNCREPTFPNVQKFTNGAHAATALARTISDWVTFCKKFPPVTVSKPENCISLGFYLKSHLLYRLCWDFEEFVEFCWVAAPLQS